MQEIKMKIFLIVNAELHELWVEQRPIDAASRVPDRTKQRYFLVWSVLSEVSMAGALHRRERAQNFNKYGLSRRSASDKLDAKRYFVFSRLRCEVDNAVLHLRNKEG